MQFSAGPEDGGFAAFGEYTLDPEQVGGKGCGGGFDGDARQGPGDSADLVQMALDPAQGIEGRREWGDSGVVGEPARGAE